MSELPDPPSPSRRGLLKTALAVGAAAWAGPVVLSSPALAQVSGGGPPGGGGGDPAVNCCTNIVTPTPVVEIGVPPLLAGQPPLPSGFVYIRWACWAFRTIVCVDGCCSPSDVELVVLSGVGTPVYGFTSNFTRCAWVQVPVGACADHEVQVTFRGSRSGTPAVPYACVRSASYDDPNCS